MRRVIRRTVLHNPYYYVLMNPKTKDGRDIVIEERNTMWFAYVDGRNVGTASLSDDGTYLTSITVEPQFRRQGVATALYNRIESDIGHKLKPSPRYQTQMAQEFWKRRR